MILGVRGPCSEVSRARTCGDRFQGMLGGTFDEGSLVVRRYVELSKDLYICRYEKIYTLYTCMCIHIYIYMHIYIDIRSNLAHSSPP